jgi:hypothetical protein
LSVAAFTSAPDSRKYSTHCTWPYCAERCSGVAPLASVTLTSTPPLIARFKVGRSPVAAASWIGSPAAIFAANIRNRTTENFARN